MTKSEESLEKQQLDEAVELHHMMEGLANSGDWVRILGRISVTLLRLVHVQETLVALARADLEATINEAVEERAQEKAAQIDEDRTKRSYIGKRPG